MRYKILTLINGKSIVYYRGTGEHYHSLDELIREVLLPAHSLDIECRVVDVDELNDENNANIFFRMIQYDKERDYWTTQYDFSADFEKLWNEEGNEGMYH